ncbi:MAG TPA: hypothetical protein PK344_17570 [Syntrophorhabdaceae bacterium]|jgi:hypothetical protein|nr:hypothetical protein [Syntrophorhabdaceae bacterium]
MTYEEIYRYGFVLGVKDGQVAARWIRSGLDVDHGDLLSATDSYAVGYRKGLNWTAPPEGTKVIRRRGLNGRRRNA